MPTERAKNRPDPAICSWVPTKPTITEEDMQAFHEAGERMKASWREQGLDPDQVVDEYFEELRKKKRDKKIA